MNLLKHCIILLRSAKAWFVYNVKSFKFELKISSLRKKNHGDGSNIPFHIIFRESKSAGFFSYLFTFFPEIISAIDLGVVPIIDMMNFESQMGTASKESKVNIWELIYEQPLDYTLDDAYLSSTLSHSNGCRKDHASYLSYNMNWAKNPGFLSYNRDIFSKYVRLKPDVETHIQMSADFLHSRKSLIGVSLRGTCYTTLKPPGHPIQPSLEEVFIRCDSLLCNGEHDGIYLASIDQDIVDGFKQRYGNDVLMLSRPTYDSKSHDLFNEIAERESYYDHLLSYVTSIYLLRYCKHIIAGVTSSTIFIPLIVESSSKMEFLYYGLYPSFRNPRFFRQWSL